MKKTPKIKPSTLILYLTKRCDSRCPYCTWILEDPDFFHTKSEYDMPLERAKEIVDYYRRLGLRSVRLQSEGEILLYKHMEEIHDYCKKIGYRNFSFPTNGIQLDKNMDFVLNKLVHVSISIDGHNAETFIKHRGGKEVTFNKIINNVRNLVKMRNSIKSKTRIIINCVMHSGDYKKVLPMLSLAEDLKVDAIRFANYHPVEGGKGLQPVGKKGLQYLTKKTAARKNKVTFTLPKPNPVEGPFTCSMLYSTALIGSDYTFAPCCRISSGAEWGTFYNDNLVQLGTDKLQLNEHMHNSATLKKFRKEVAVAKLLKDLPEACRKCGHLRRSKN